MEALMNFLPLRPDSTVVDIGCGDGRFLRSLGENPSIQGIGIDLNESKIANARAESISMQSPSELSFIHADINTPYAEYCQEYQDASPDEFISIHEYLKQAQRLNLRLLYAFESSLQESDQYQAYLWQGRSDDERLLESQIHYCEWIRRLFGWCLLLFARLES